MARRLLQHFDQLHHSGSMGPRLRGDDVESELQWRRSPSIGTPYRCTRIPSITTVEAEFAPVIELSSQSWRTCALSWNVRDSL